MLRRHLICAGLGVVLGLAASCGVELPSLSAQGVSESPLFTKGQAYLFLSGCLPVWMPMMAAASMQAPQGLNPCYAEALTVEGPLRADGWLEVSDPENGRHWFLNTARVYAMQAQVTALRAAR